MVQQVAVSGNIPMIPGDLGVSSVGEEKLGKDSFAPRMARAGPREGNRRSRSAVGSLGRSPYNLVVTDRTSQYNRIMVGRPSGVKDDSPSFPKKPAPNGH